MAIFAFCTLIAAVKPHGALAFLKLLGIAQLLFVALFASRFSTLLPARPKDHLNFAADPWNTPEELANRAELQKASEADSLAIMEISDPARARRLADPTRVKWNCPECGSENPATFDICWKCQRARLDAETAE